MNRRQVLLSTLAASVAVQERAFAASGEGARLRHSVCRGPFSKIDFDEFCEACKGMGIESIELLTPEDYPTVIRHGLECAVGRFTSKKLPASHLVCGWNDPVFHPVLLEGYTDLIQKTAEAGFGKVICFSGSRKGMDDATGLENCAAGLSRLMPLCEKLGVTMVMELLNSKVNHAAAKGKQRLFGVSVGLILADGMFYILSSPRIFQFKRNNREAVDEQGHVQRIVVAEAVMQLTGDGKYIGLI